MTPKYLCKCCDYSVQNKTNFIKHINTKKHQQLYNEYIRTNSATPIEPDNFMKKEKNICDVCKTSYKTHSGLWKHKQQSCYGTSTAYIEDKQVDYDYSVTNENDNDNDNIADIDYDYNDDDTAYDNNTYTETNTYKMDDDDFFTKSPVDESNNINKDHQKDTIDTDASVPTMSMIMKLAEMFLEHQQKMSTTQIETQKQMNEKQFENQMQVNEQIVTAITELKNTAIELKKAVPSVASNITNNNTTNTNTNSNNNLTQNNIQNINDIKFNMNMYLHEYCKNAINITEFFNKIIANVDASVYELLGRKGYVQGITELILEELKKYKDYERPVHCVDYRRETMVIKHNNEWNKDICKVPGNITTSVIGRGIYAISERNKYNVTQKDLQEQAKYGVASCKEKDIEILRHAIGHYKIKNVEKVISNIAKNTTIDKEGYIRQLKDKLTKQMNGECEIENV